MVSGALGGAGCGGPWCYQDRLLRAGKRADGKELENADPPPPGEQERRDVNVLK